MSAPLSRARTSTDHRPLPWKLAAALAGALGLAVASPFIGRPFAAAAPPTAHNAPDRRHDGDEDAGRGADRRTDAQRIAEGRDVFRYDTYGDEQQWTDRLRMHEVIESAVDPLTALALGLKVDVDALPDEVIDAIEIGAVDLTDPATTLALIQLDAVVGVVGRVETVDGRDRLKSVGITCALCHSTVDDSFAPGIGHRLDGWPNVDLDPGAIIAASPAVPPADKAVYASWGPGKYDPRFNIDGKNTPLVIPPAFGLSKVASETYTAEGPVSYWNRYVAVTQMGGHGSFHDEKLGIHIVQNPDLVKHKLGVLRDYQFSLETPAPPAGSFDPAAAARGKAVFQGAGRCASCHIPGSSYTDVNRGVLHAPAETGMDPAYALRTTTQKYRTTPLRALWAHAPYFHDGSARTLEDVVQHYDTVLRLGLTPAQKQDLAEFLRSL
jgi:mono/diheme cytochrome c family protein